MEIDPGLVASIVALLTGLGGLYVSRRGQSETRRQQEAANVIAERQQSLDEAQALAAMAAEAARAATARAAEEHARAEAEAARAERERVRAEVAERRLSAAREQSADLLDELTRIRATWKEPTREPDQPQVD